MAHLGSSLPGRVLDVLEISAALSYLRGRQGDEKAQGHGCLTGLAEDQAGFTSNVHFYFNMFPSHVCHY